MNKTFVTGVDKNLQDLLPWWVSNIRKHDKETHITIADFGMSPEWREWAKKNCNSLLKYPKHPKCSWFWKPHTLIAAPYEYKCWIDIDCEVLTNISEIFNFVDGSNIAVTPDPCRRIEVEGERWLATGVNVVKGTPEILKNWHNQSTNTTLRGDQEILHEILKDSSWRENIVEMPLEYQWLRILLARKQDHPNKKIIHWTGPYGKEYIRKNLMKK